MAYCGSSGTQRSRDEHPSRYGSRRAGAHAGNLRDQPPIISLSPNRRSAPGDRIKAGLAYVGREILQHSLTKRGFKGRVVSHRSPRKEARSSDSVGKSPNCRLRLRFWPSVIATLAQPFKTEGM